MTLAGDLHDSELRNGEDVVLGLVVGHSGFHFVKNLSLITFVLHVDEVDDDQSTQVAKAHLAGDFHGRFHVGLQNEVFSILTVTLVTTCVDVDRNQGFRFLHHDLATGRQKHSTHEGLFDLTFHVETFEDRYFLVEKGNLGFGLGRNPLDRLDQPVVIVLLVDLHPIDFVGEKIPCSQSDQIRFLVKEGRTLLGIHLRLDFIPFLQEYVQIPVKKLFRLFLANRPDDYAHAFAQREVADDAFQPGPLRLVFNLTRDATLARVRHENKKTSGKRQVGGGARTFAPDLSLCDLNDDFRSYRKSPGNVLYGFGFRTLRFFPLVLPDNLNRGIVVGPGKHIPIMKEGIFLLSNVDEGCLESGFEVLNFPFENGSDHSVLVETFDVESLKNSILHDGDPSLEGLRIDDQFLVVLVGLAAEKRFDSLANRSFLGSVEGLFPQFPLVDMNGPGLDRRRRHVLRGGRAFGIGGGRRVAISSTL